jgi:galactose-6-phosphate isomerase
MKVVNKEADFGIVICGTGVGITNAINKIKGIRCPLVKDVITAELSRKEFDANAIGFGGNILGVGLMYESIQKFIETKFDPKNKEIVSYMDLMIESFRETSFQDELEK